MIDASLQYRRSKVLSAHTGLLLHGPGAGKEQQRLAQKDAEIPHSNATGLQLSVECWCDLKIQCQGPWG
jgi:hypothetical protein